MLNVVCAQCGTTFGAKRSTAQYCKPSCRVAATRQRARTGDASPARLASTAPNPVVQPRRDGPALVALPPMHESEEGLIAVTRRTLTKANRMDSYHGVVAMAQARILDSGVQDSMSSMAAMFKEYKASMAAALDGSIATETPLERIRREREVKAG